MRKFFKEHGLDCQNNLSANRVNKIKYSVLSRIEEEKTMKKQFKLKTFFVAAAAAAASVGATLAITAGAAGNGQPTYSVKINGDEVPYSVEVTRGEDYPYTRPTDGKLLTAHDETTIIKYQLPEEIVTSGDGIVVATYALIIDENGNMVGANRSDDGYGDVIKDLPIEHYEEVTAQRQFSIKVKYDEAWLAQGEN